jgi:hypothetical protein
MTEKDMGMEKILHYIIIMSEVISVPALHSFPMLCTKSSGIVISHTGPLLKSSGTMFMNLSPILIAL